MVLPDGFRATLMLIPVDEPDRKWRWAVKQIRFLLKRADGRKNRLPPGLLHRLFDILNKQMMEAAFEQSLSTCHDTLVELTMQMMMEELHFQSAKVAVGISQGALTVEYDPETFVLKSTYWRRTRLTDAFSRSPQKLNVFVGKIDGERIVFISETIADAGRLNNVVMVRHEYWFCHISSSALLDVG